VAKDIDKQFPIVLDEMDKLISDIRVAMDLVEVEVAHWRRDGITQCDTHTGEDIMGKISACQGHTGYLGIAFQLLAYYHFYKTHPEEIAQAGVEAIIFRAQMTRLEQLFDRHMFHRRQREAEATPASPDAKPADGWLDRIFKKRGD
jgi:hypothetical protein